MKTNLKEIKPKNIHNMLLVATEEGTPAICVITNESEAIKHPLTNAFEIHECNEFLKSLNMEDIHIEFYSYEHYSGLIETCAEMLNVQRIMKRQRSLGKAPANEVHSVVLDTLEDEGWNHSMIYIPDLPRYVKKATEKVKQHYRSVEYVPMG